MINCYGLTTTPIPLSPILFGAGEIDAFKMRLSLWKRGDKLKMFSVLFMFFAVLLCYNCGKSNSSCSGQVCFVLGSNLWMISLSSWSIGSFQLNFSPFSWRVEVSVFVGTWQSAKDNQPYLCTKIIASSSHLQPDFSWIYISIHHSTPVMRAISSYFCKFNKAPPFQMHSEL